MQEAQEKVNENRDVTETRKFIEPKNKVSMYFSTSVIAFYEVAFVFLPLFVWSIAIFSLGGERNQVLTLLAWPFCSLTIYSTILKDGLLVFRNSDPKDRRQLRLLIIMSLIGTVLSVVLLTLGIVSSKIDNINLFTPYYISVYALIGFGAILLFMVKSIVSQRDDFGFYT